MPLSHLNRRRFSHVVGIIPGPKELEEYKQYGPTGEVLEGILKLWAFPTDRL